MKIVFERFGGPIVTQRKCADIDTAALSKTERARVEHWAKCAFDDSTHGHPRDKRRRPSGFEYVIQIEHEGRSRTLEFDDKSAPDDLRPLLGFLMKHAKSVPIDFA